MKKITLLFILLTMSLGYAQDPSTGPADPPARNAGDVMAFYNGIATPTGDDYTVLPGLTFDSFGGSTIVGDVTLADGNTVIKYTNHLYHGIGSGSYDVSQMEMLHVDVYSPDFTIFAIKLEANDGSNVELPVSDPKVQGAWNSYEIDLSAYAAVDLVNLKWIVPVTYEPPGTTLYLDNIYFYRVPVDPATDATLSDLQIDNSTISGFSPGTLSYTYEVPTGTTIVPQITLATPTEVGNGATASITQATGIPGDATVLVTSSDMSTTATYTVSIVEIGPATAAPTPPARAATDVISVFSDAYSDVAPSGVNTFAGASWDNFTIESADDTRRLTAPSPGGGAQLEYIGVSPLDLTDFTHMHVDFYVEGTATAGSVFQIYLIDFPNHPAGDGSYSLNTQFEITVVGTGAWVSGDVEISTFNNGAAAKDKIALVQLVAAGPAYGPIYIDNIYFHKNTTLGTNDFETADFSIYPNPSNTIWNVKTNDQIINTVQVFDVLGKEVISIKPNLSDVSIDASTLPKGLYFAKLTTEFGSNSVKLIKN